MYIYMPSPEDSKIDSLDTHDEGGSTLALEGTTQLAELGQTMQLSRSNN